MLRHLTESGFWRYANLKLILNLESNIMKQSSCLCIEEQFEITSVIKDIFLVREPYFLEHANMYVIKGTAFDLLVDCGVGLFNPRKFLEQQGFNVKVLLTHSYFDHAGGLRYFSPEKILVTSRVLHNLRRRETWALEFLKPEDFTLKQRALVEDFCSGFQTEVDKKIKAFSWSKISVGVFNFDIFPSPGHSDDSVVLYDKRSGVLITGDALYDGGLYTGFINSDNKQFKRSLQRLAKLPADIVLPGHNAVMDRGRAHQVIQRWVGELDVMIRRRFGG